MAHTDTAPSGGETQAETETGLLLRGSVLGMPASFLGAVKGGELKELAGVVSTRKTLSSFLADLANALGKTGGEAGDKLTRLLGQPKITLEEVGVRYTGGDKSVAQFVAGVRAGAVGLLFTLLKQLGDDSGGFLVGVDLEFGGTALASNPLHGVVGDIILKRLSVHYASTPLEDVPACSIDELPKADELALAKIPEGDGSNFSQGFNLDADISIGDLNLFDVVDAPKEEQAGEQPAAPRQQSLEKKQETGLAEGHTFWKSVDRSIGPVSVRRVGLSYDAPRVGIKLDAGLRLSSITLSLEGLGISYRIDKLTTDAGAIWRNLQFHLDGAGLAFDQGPLTISGGLLKVSDEGLRLDGALLIRAKAFTISALASYAELDGTFSFFAFAALHKELGGPPCFFVTGLAFGFGVNRALELPSINEVQDYPLIKAAVDPNYLGKDLPLPDISAKLDQYMKPSPGSFWMAAGVRFTSFGQMDSVALLSLSLGTQTEIEVLGLSRIRVPKEGERELAYAELAIKAVVAPESGVLSIEGRLTGNSYILRKDFKLRGGFAFYSWFSGQHAGDFVVSLGGYHSRFQPPAHYPRPDLVEFNCRTGDIAIQGSCYFALCPSAIMAGGRLSVVYQSGGIKAWFIAYADFLIQWKPLYYDVAVGASIGVALSIKVWGVRMSVTGELAAKVQLHGPPLGGKARISYYCVSFTVSFGAGKSIPLPLVWEDSRDPEKSFVHAFLPDPGFMRIAITDGLLEERRNGQESVPVVNPHQLVLNCESLVPATAVKFGCGKPDDGQVVKPSNGRPPAKLGVRPMDKKSFYSCITATLTTSNGATADARECLRQYIDCSAVTRKVPSALWATEKFDAHVVPAPDAQMIDNALVGLEIRTKPGPRPSETEPMDLDVLAYERRSKRFQWTRAKPTDELRGSAIASVSETVMERAVRRRREDIVAVLRQTKPEIMDAGTICLEMLKNRAPFMFQARPVPARVGQYPPRDYAEV